MASKYNKDLPMDIILMREIPGEIRKKGETIINYISELEEKRTFNRIEPVLKLYPSIKHIFIDGSSNIPCGLYNNVKENVWIGNGNYSHLPNSFEKFVEGERYSINNQTFEYIKDGELNIWAEKSVFYPQLFFDFFEINDNKDENIISNRGISNSNVSFKTLRIKRYEEFNLPYLISTKNSESCTTEEYKISNSFTFSTTFIKISREYLDGTEETIAPEHDSVLLYVKDKFQNIKIGICYDKDFNLYYFSETTKHKLDYKINENTSYNISIRYIDNKVRILINGKEDKVFENQLLLNKNLFFSVANDMFYGEYSNGAVIFTEPQVFSEALTMEENSWLKENPRAWSFKYSPSYLDFTLEEKLKLKKLLKTL